jgi:hypothetical protein
MSHKNNSSSVPWGDRTRLLSKDMKYVFSLDFRATSEGRRLQIVKDEKSVALRHVFGHSMVTTADGAPCDVPTGHVNWGDLEVGDALGVSPSWMSLRLSILLTGGPTLTFESAGVISFDAGRDAIFSMDVAKLRGSAFMSSQQQASVAAYRWLERRQLFGVGVFEGREEDTAKWLEFSFDLYSAA